MAIKILKLVLLWNSRSSMVKERPNHLFHIQTSTKSAQAVFENSFCSLHIFYDPKNLV